MSCKLQPVTVSTQNRTAGRKTRVDFASVALGGVTSAGVSAATLILRLAIIFYGLVTALRHFLVARGVAPKSVSRLETIVSVTRKGQAPGRESITLGLQMGAR